MCKYNLQSEPNSNHLVFNLRQNLSIKLREIFTQKCIWLRGINALNFVACKIWTALFTRIPTGTQVSDWRFRSIMHVHLGTSNLQPPRRKTHSPLLDQCGSHIIRQGSCLGAKITMKNIRYFVHIIMKASNVRRIRYEQFFRYAVQPSTKTYDLHFM